MGRLANAVPTAKGRAAEAATRGSGIRAAVFLVLAVAAALLAGVLFSRYLDRRAMATATRKVVVATVDIPAASTLRADLLKTADWPKSFAPEGCFEDLKALEGKVVRANILKGEPVLKGRIVTGEAGQGLSAILPADMRAVSVRVDDVVGVAGFIHPGDSVDVIVTMKPFEESDSPPTSKVILQNVKVLAVGKEIDRKDKKLDKAVPVTVATLMVNSENSERLALASAKGKILLALRSGADAAEIETPGVVPAVLLEGTPAMTAKNAPPPEPQKASSPGARPGRAPARADPSKAEPAKKPGHEVEILRGDLFEKREFKSQESKP